MKDQYGGYMKEFGIPDAQSGFIRLNEKGQQLLKKSSSELMRQVADNPYIVLETAFTSTATDYFNESLAKRLCSALRRYMNKPFKPKERFYYKVSMVQL